MKSIEELAVSNETRRHESLRRRVPYSEGVKSMQRVRRDQIEANAMALLTRCRGFLMPLQGQDQFVRETQGSSALRDYPGFTP